MGFFGLWTIQLFIYCSCGSVASGQSSIGATALYIKSIAKLCGWAECQGFCQQRDELVPVGEYYDSTDRACTTSRYNSVVQDARQCPSAVCVTQNTFQQNCQPSSTTRTVCFSLYVNASTTRVHPRVCWDRSMCMDLVNFCQSQKSFSCISYGSATTAPPTTRRQSTKPIYTTSPEKMPSKSSSTHPGTTFLLGSPTAEPIQGQPTSFIAGIIIGICVAAMPIIIGAVVLCIIRKRTHRMFPVKDSTYRSESIEMTDGPVYASIGPEVPPKPPGSQILGPSHLPFSSGITSSARSLHIVGPRGSTLLGNLQRNKSLPALAYAVNSIPMESNDLLRAMSQTNQRSRSTRSPQSPNIVGDQMMPPHHIEGHGVHSTSSPLSSPSKSMDHLSPGVVESRLISPRDSEQGLTNKLYSEAVLPGPPSAYSTDGSIPHQYINLRGSCDQLLSEHKTKTTTERNYASIERGPSVEQSRDDTKPSSQYMGLESAVDMSGSSSGQYMGLVECGPADNGSKLTLSTSAHTSGQYMGLESVGNVSGRSAGQYMGLIECGPGDNGTVKPIAEDDSVVSNIGNRKYLELEANSQYMGLDAATMSDSTTNEYMGITGSTKTYDKEHLNFHITPPTDGVYMGLEDIKNTNQYMGIGDGSIECDNTSLVKDVPGPPLVSGSGAYSELNLRSGDIQQQGVYMGLKTVELSDTAPRKDSQDSGSSYVDLDPNAAVGASITKKGNRHKAEKGEEAAAARRKYWKSKSTFQKRKPSEDGLNTSYEGLQPPQKAKKSFLFKSKKQSKPSGKGVSEEAGGDLCLDLKISSPPPVESAKPLYFTLDVSSSTYGRCIGDKTNMGSVRESQPFRSNGEGKDAAFNLQEPFRPRSKSQPIQHSSSQYEEYEIIENN